MRNPFIFPVKSSADAKKEQLKSIRMHFILHVRRKTVKTGFFRLKYSQYQINRQNFTLQSFDSFHLNYMRRNYTFAALTCKHILPPMERNKTAFFGMKFHSNACTHRMRLSNLLFSAFSRICLSFE